MNSSSLSRSETQTAEVAALPLRIAGYFSPLSRLSRPTGVGQHVLAMLDELARRDGVRLSLISTPSEFAGGEEALPVSVRGARRWMLPDHERWMRVALTQLPLANVDRWVRDVDWVYCPKEQPVGTSRARLAVTVHDILALEGEIPGLPRRHSWSRRRIAARTLARAARQADVLLTVSEFTRQRLLEILPVAPRRIAVVGNGVAPHYLRSRAPADVDVLKRFEVETEGYFLAVGSLTRRKGGDLLLEVARRLRTQQRETLPPIVVVGRRHDPDLLAEYEELKRDDPGLPLRLAGYVSDEDLAVLLSNSLALLFPSRYEGFGIPIVEALACGAPVVCANSSALPEVAGGHARLVAHDSADELWDAVRELMNEPGPSRRQRIEAGRQYGQQCTWRACVDRLLSALNES